MITNSDQLASRNRIRIGYPCLNHSVPCQANRTFRLRSYTPELLVTKIQQNLACLRQILCYNIQHDLRFFRISSDLIPFASHQVNQFDWPNYFQTEFRQLGQLIRDHDLRISMHPDQFTLLNPLDPEILQRSIAELNYHCQVLDLLELDQTAKVQLHVGGVYGDKTAAMERFVQNYLTLPAQIKRRLVIENDDRAYTVQDCVLIHAQTQIPVLFDTLHHEILNQGESLATAFLAAQQTWQPHDGVIMVDYSSQAPNSRRGKHTATLDAHHFEQTIRQLTGDYDLMLEIKDKELSALRARAKLLVLP